MSKSSGAAPHAPLKVRLRKAVFALHGLLGLGAMLALLFFAFTGLMLNNAESWNLGEPHESTREVKLDAGAADKWTDKDAAIVAVLRAGVGVSGVPEVPETADGRMTLVFNSAGVRRTVEVSQADGSARITTESKGVSGRLMALHRGEYVANGWHWLMDAAAVSLILITLSGFVLWFSTPRLRRQGVVALALSVVAVAGAYCLFV